MTTYKIQYISCVLIASVMGSVVLGSGPAIAQEVLPAELENTLKRNVEEISPITILWEKKCTSDYEEKEMLARIKFPETALDVLAPERSQFTWQNGMFYQYFWRHTPAFPARSGKGNTSKKQVILLATEQERAYDGAIYYNGTPSTVPGEPAHLHIDPIDKDYEQRARGRLSVITLSDPRYLELAGFQVPLKAKELYERVPIKASCLALIEEGSTVNRVRRENDNNVACFIVDLLRPNGRKVQLLFDIAKGCALIRRLETTVDAKLVSKTECTQLEKIVGKTSLWLPRRITAEWHTWPSVPQVLSDKALIREVFTVTQFSSAKLSLNTFSIRSKYQKAGDRIADGTLSSPSSPKQRVAYNVPANKKELDQIIRQATASSGHRSTIRILVIVISPCILVTLLVIISRLRSKSF